MTLGKLLNESYDPKSGGYDNVPVDGAKKVWVSEYKYSQVANTGGFGHFGNTMDFSQKEPIGFMANKHNMAVGWSIFELDKYDIKELKNSKLSTKNMYRVASDKGTSIVRLNLKTARMTWIDTQANLDTGVMSLEKTSSTWDRLVVNIGDNYKIFGIKKDKVGNYEL